MKQAVCVFILFLIPFVAFAQEGLPYQDSYVRARVLSVSPERRSDFSGVERSSQDAVLMIVAGEQEGKIIEIENAILNNRDDMRLNEGETVVMQRFEKPDGEVIFLVREKYRLPSLMLLAVVFFALAILFGGTIGFTSILGLMVSIAILVFFVVPRIVAGGNSLLISLIGSVLIACLSLYLAHGYNRRTTVALISTMITLACATVLAVIFVRFGKLFGMGTEESVYLQLGPLQQVNLRGLLLGGIIIGALGVLDDITTAQTAAIDELSKANSTFGFRELYRAGLSVGREHIAALINTLALAYVGASLPLLLLFSLDTEVPWWVTVNSEFVAEEIVRTLVGSSALLLAVPISTWIAASVFGRR